MPIPQKTTPLEKMSIRDRIYMELCDWIIDGTLMPGERIYDSEIAEHFNVSRTPVREAIQMLSDQRLVDINPNIGTSVSEVDGKETSQVYSLLAILHCEALREAFISLDDEKIELLEKCNEKLQNAIKKNNPKACMEADAKFHDIILDAADNPFLSDCASKIITHILRIEYARFHERPRNISSANDHKHIIDAIKKGNKNIAVLEMQKNWLSFSD